MPVQVKPRKAAATIAELVAPLTEAEFIELLRERKMTLIRSANDRYTPWLGWEAVLRLIDRGEYSRAGNDVRLTRESHFLPPQSWKTAGKIDVGKLEQHL